MFFKQKRVAFAAHENLRITLGRGFHDADVFFIDDGGFTFKYTPVIGLSCGFNLSLGDAIDGAPKPHASVQAIQAVVQGAPCRPLTRHVDGGFDLPAALFEHHVFTKLLD